MRKTGGNLLARILGQRVEGLHVAQVGGGGERSAEHSDLLPLVDERSASLEEVGGCQGRRGLVPKVIGVAETAHGARLIVVLEVESVPSPLFEGSLPAGQHLGKLSGAEGARGETAPFESQVDVLELNEHVELVARGIAE